MSRAKIDLGRRGEALAAAELERTGYRIVARNVRTPYGEIDIIAESDGTTAFVEVRTKRGSDFGAPEESLNLRKRQRMEQSALHYIAERGDDDPDWRLDLVAVEMNREGKLLRLDHHRGIEV